MQYILSKEVGQFVEYALFVADTVTGEDISWDLSITDVREDATKFSDFDYAWEMLMKQDWDSDWDVEVLD